MISLAAFDIISFRNFLEMGMSETKLVGKPRYRVVYWPKERGQGRRRSVVAMEKPATREIKVLGQIVAFASQETGDIYVISTELVDYVVKEQQDAKYGEWYEIGRYEVYRA